LAPSAATVAEQEWAQASPPGVTTVCARYYLEAVTPENLNHMMGEVDRAAREVASARVDVIAQCGTPGVFINGFGYDREVIERIERNTGIRATTVMTSAIEALKTFGGSRIAVATAYADDMNEMLREFLVASGFTVTTILGLGIVRNVEIGDVGPETAYRLGRRVMREADGAQALYISCGNLRTFEVIEALEEDLGVPVTTSSQAAFWHSLRLAGVRTSIRGYGSLLQR